MIKDFIAEWTKVQEAAKTLLTGATPLLDEWKKKAMSA